MRQFLAKTLAAAMFLLAAFCFTGCAKEGCPANQSLHNETMGGPTKKKGKAPKNTSGIIPPADKHKKY